ncbi:hypothetical protein [Marmoricola sp. RAF53]|uniref:hypothetical protein n=1 Tax=Marmoricola sp. RAF53 TaxID=3233059 RepID=UPI003F9C33D6
MPGPIALADSRPGDGSGGARADTLRQLQDRIAGMQDGVPRIPVVTHPALAGLLQLRTGSAYEVDSAALALALLAPPSQEGSWTAVVGAGDLGVEAAAETGVDLTRTILVPDPGEHWLEATAALVDVVTVVLLQPPPGVTERTASRISARLRKRSTVLVVLGRWPGSEARLEVERSTWTGAERGHGRLRDRRIVVGVRRGAAPVRRTELELTAGGGLRPVATDAADLGSPIVLGAG